MRSCDSWLILPAEKKKGADTPSTNSAAASPGAIVNPVDETLRDSFPTGRPLEDQPDRRKCNTCKKVMLETAWAKHNKECQKAKAEKLKKKKEAKEAREREKREENKKENDKDEEGDTKMDDDDDNEEEPSPEKKGPGGLKSAKKSAGKKVEIDDTKKGKKRKAEGDAEKGPKQKKKKEEPKPKVPKQRGIVTRSISKILQPSISIVPVPSR